MSSPAWVMPLAAALLAAGCLARMDRPLLMAQETVVVCKHCNCYMPVPAAPQAACTVCECGYSADQCVRGQ